MIEDERGINSQLPFQRLQIRFQLALQCHISQNYPILTDRLMHIRMPRLSELSYIKQKHILTLEGLWLEFQRKKEKN